MQWMDISRKRIEDLLINKFANRDSILNQAMAYASLNGGKRLRPLLSIATGMVSNANQDDLYTVGAAIELIHCYSLVHDDLPAMDNDDLRRGIPTCHIKYGDAMAILVGDALQTMAFEIISQPMKILPENQLKIIHILANASGEFGMVGGQSLDILNTHKKLTLDELTQMHALKTGALIKASVLCGYLVGDNINIIEYNLLSQIADNLGVLFQVVDDILDYTGDTITLGKTAHKDEIQEKATFVSIFGLQQAQDFALELYEKTIIQIAQLPNNNHLLDLTHLIFKRNN